MRKSKKYFHFNLTVILAAIFILSANLHAQTKTLNVEPENPPGYSPNSLAPAQKPGVQMPAPQAPVAPPAASPGAAPVPAANSSPPTFPSTSPPGTSPEEKPAMSNFQNPTDISKAIRGAAPNPSDPNFSAPTNPPNYPPPQPAPSSKNKIIDVLASIPEKKIFATVTTSMGSFKIKLYPQYAPKTVKNFIDLATGQKEFVEVATSKKSTRPFYNGQIVFKVVRDFVVQMGCPFGDGRGGPGYEVADEFTPYLHHDKAGMVSMANHGPNTGGSQFFITLNSQPSFDEKYSVFGEVISGMEVVYKISKVKTGPTSRPLKRIVVQKIEIEGL